HRDPARPRPDIPFRLQQDESKTRWCSYYSTTSIGAAQGNVQAGADRYGRYLPFWLRAIASRVSRSAVLRRSVSRLSQSCLPLASASSTLTLPFLKYIRVGISVSPRCWVLPISRRSSSLWTSSLRVRSGAWLKILPCSYGPMWQFN